VAAVVLVVEVVVPFDVVVAGVVDVVVSGCVVVELVVEDGVVVVVLVVEFVDDVVCNCSIVVSQSAISHAFSLCGKPMACRVLGNCLFWGNHVMSCSDRES